MCISIFRYYVLIALFALYSFEALAQDSKSPGADSGVVAADQLYLSGKFGDAQTAYETLLKANPSLAPAEAGLVRSLVRQNKIDEAVKAANQGLVASPNSAPVLSAMGDVQFRMGLFGEAQAAYLKAKKLDPKDVRSYLGLADLYSVSLYSRHAYDEVQRAYEIDPNNLEVMRARMGYLPRKARLELLESYMAGPHPDDSEETRHLQVYLAFLKATIDKPRHSCRLANKTDETQVKLENMMHNTQMVEGVGLPVKLNDHVSHLMLDTGAGGILVTRHVAEKAGLVRIAEQAVGGIGDKGERSGYTALAEHIRIGGLEFQDCLVVVTDKSFGDQDGLIGADVFRRYLIELDFYGLTMKLSALPKRPEQSEAEASLDTEGEGMSPEDTAGAQGVEKPLRIPQDRYIAPEMKDWTKIFRFGHMLLIPTLVNDSKSRLFLIDSGSARNIISTRTAQEVTNVSSNDRMHVSGLSGSVAKVYSADSVTLQFAPFKQKNQQAITLDLSNLSKHVGTEMSGIIGFSTLRLLKAKIDYRDGLVEFTYDPSRFPGLR